MRSKSSSALGELLRKYPNSEALLRNFKKFKKAYDKLNPVVKQQIDLILYLKPMLRPLTVLHLGSWKASTTKEAIIRLKQAVNSGLAYQIMYEVRHNIDTPQEEAANYFKRAHNGEALPLFIFAQAVLDDLDYTKKITPLNELVQEWDQIKDNHLKRYQALSPALQTIINLILFMNKQTKSQSFEKKQTLLKKTNSELHGAIKLHKFNLTLTTGVEPAIQNGSMLRLLTLLATEFSSRQQDIHFHMQFLHAHLHFESDEAGKWIIKIATQLFKAQFPAK